MSSGPKVSLRLSSRTVAPSNRASRGLPALVPQSRKPGPPASASNLSKPRSVATVVARVYDPFRGEIFAHLGLRTFSPTNIGADLAYEALFRE